MKKSFTFIVAALFLSSTGQIDAQIIAGGSHHSLFLCSSGEVMACGRNHWGQLGDGTVTQRNPSVQVSGLSGITAVAASGINQYNQYSGHSVFLKNDGTVWACGYNDSGQLGDGTNTERHFPVQVSGLSGIIAVAAGVYHSLFLKNDGTVWACGRNNSGELGDGTVMQRNSPVQVSPTFGGAITAIAAGENYSLFLKNDGTVWACGYNNYGQLGDGTTSGKITPGQVSGLSGIIAIAAGNQHSLFLKNDGTVWACGYNNYGQLGDGTTFNRYTPVQVNPTFGGAITAVAGGYWHSLFLKIDGTVWACGRGGYGQLGNGTGNDRRSPFPVSPTFGGAITAVAAGGLHSLFLKNDGTVWACGNNDYGQLGNGTGIANDPAVQVQNLCVVSASISMISGRILTEADVPIPGVTVMLIGDDTLTSITDTIGTYNFSVEPGGSYTITPSKSNDSIPNTGVTLIDALLMRRHILGTPLNSPYKIIAAAECNAAADTLVSTNDILLTRSLILGNANSFPTNRLWQFVPSDYVFADSNHPFPFPTSRTYTNITTNQTNQDFIGIKLGDVNESWDPNTP